jgi:hypothetical protein
MPDPRFLGGVTLPWRAGDPPRSLCLMTMPSELPVPLPALRVVGGVPLLDPPLFPREDDEDMARMAGATSPEGAGISRQKNSLPSQRFLRSACSFSSRFRSKAARYRS